MSYTLQLKVDNDEIDEIVRSELQFQRSCCDESERDLIEALDRVIRVFTPPSEIIQQEAEVAQADLFEYYP